MGSLQGHENRVSCLGVSMDAISLCTGSWDSTVSSPQSLRSFSNAACANKSPNFSYECGLDDQGNPERGCVTDAWSRATILCCLPHPGGNLQKFFLRFLERACSLKTADAQPWSSRPSPLHPCTVTTAHGSLFPPHEESCSTARPRDMRCLCGGVSMNIVL